jgi:hypothetical protein
MFVPQQQADVAATDFDYITQKRLRTFLLNCAKQGIPITLDASRQSNATFDTMLEVREECDARGIPLSEQPIAATFDFPIPPTPKTNAHNCLWNVGSQDRHDLLAPEVPEDDGTLRSKNYPDFSTALDRERRIRSSTYHFCMDSFENAMDQNYLNVQSDDDMMTITEIMRIFGPGFPAGYTFDPAAFAEAYVFHYLKSRNDPNYMSFDQLMVRYGPQDPHNVNHN